MADGIRYHLRRGRMPRLVDQLATEPRGSDIFPRVVAGGTADGVPRIAADDVADGSTPDLQPLGLDDELGELAMPVVERTPTPFGATEFVVEHHGERIALVLPGSVRLFGTAAEARALAALLLRKPRR